MMTTQKDILADLAKRKQFVDLYRVTRGLIPHSGIHPIIPQTKEQKRLEFERGTFNEIN